MSHTFITVFNLKSMKDDPLERTQYVMQLVHVNSDGQLSKIEFLEGCMKDDNLRDLLQIFKSLVILLPSFFFIQFV